ncbi:MAG: histidine kinase [Bacteroidota bacterium]
MYLLKSIITSILLSCSFFIFSQRIEFENYTTKDGLISDEVYKIFQDKKGYIWLFTNYGTIKYSGKEYIPVLKNLPFSESFIYAFYENNKGQKWVANSNAKIYKIINDSAFIVNGIKELTEKLKKEGSEIEGLIVDKNTNIYINTKRGAYKLLNDNNYYKVENMCEDRDADSIYCYVYKFNQDLFYALSHRYIKLNANRQTKDLIIKFKFEDQYFNYSKIIFKEFNLFTPSLFKRKNDVVYFSFRNKLYKINKDLSLKSITLNSQILEYVIDKNNHKWIGTLNNGLYELDQNDSVINNYLIEKTINHVFIDSEDGLWLSSDGAGIFHCKNMNELTFKESSIYQNKINFIKQIESKLLIVNSTGDIFIIDEKKTIKIKNEKKENYNVYDIIKVKNDYLINYRTNLELLSHSNSFKKINLPLIKPSFFPIKLYNISKDSILCLSNNSIVILSEGTQSLLKQNKILTLDHKVFDFSMRNHIKFFATDNGIYELINNHLVQPKYLLTSQKCKVVKIHKDIYENLWFSTKGNGFFMLNKQNKLFHITEKNGLPSNIINHIAFTNDNKILLSTNIGLFQSSDFKKWDEIHSEQVKISTCNFNGINFLTKNGLIIRKKSLTEKEKYVYLNLTYIKVNGKLSNNETILNLDYDNNNLEFNFDAISFSSTVPEINYKLISNKKEIGSAKNQQIILKNIQPGSYLLEIYLNTKTTKYEPIHIKFNILPAFWQTSWFLILSILLVMIITTSTIFIILHYKRKKNEKKNETNRLITEYKLIALKAQINPHFISNCLTAIQNLIAYHKTDLANQYIAKFSLLVRQVLNFSSKSLVSLEEELEITKLNLELEQLRFDKKFDFKIIYDNSVDLKMILVPPLIIQPIVENAIWHGLLHLNKKRNGLLFIKIELTDSLKIIIEDNGIGRTKNTNDIGNLKKSKGIKITKQRILNLNNLYNKKNGDLLYEDLVDKLENSIGTRVSIILPILIKDEDGENKNSDY